MNEVQGGRFVGRVRIRDGAMRPPLRLQPSVTATPAERAQPFLRRNPRTVSQSTENLAPPLPQNADAERAVLGAILVDDGKLSAVIEKLKPEDFYVREHHTLYAEMLAMHVAG